MMDPVTLILAAVVGVSSGAGDAAAASVRDAYEGLKGLFLRRFAGDPKAVETLADAEADPETYERPLARQIKATQADRDEEILAAAEAVLEKADVAGVKTKYHFTVTGGKVGITGDHGHIDTMS